MHLFCGPIDVEAYTEQAAARPSGASRGSTSDLAERVAALETEVAALKARFDSAD